MITPIQKAFGIRDPTPHREPQKRKAALPKNHPCHGCIALDWRADVPYCFLPRCNRTLFEIKKEETDA